MTLQRGDESNGGYLAPLNYQLEPLECKTRLKMRKFLDFRYSGAKKHLIDKSLLKCGEFLVCNCELTAVKRDIVEECFGIR